jgi:hypothetical protein
MYAWQTRRNRTDLYSCKKFIHHEIFHVPGFGQKGKFHLCPVTPDTEAGGWRNKAGTDASMSGVGGLALDWLSKWAAEPSDYSCS